jgi:peptidoglycan/LPS O-acetylase OafA/YrhL
VARSAPTANSAPADAHDYRPYLDGLRAVDVLGVLVYHLDRSWLPGGYLGVDLFFVLSGYLITSLLVEEHVRTGRIDLPAFWARRIRRLMPALLVVLVVVAVVVQLRGDVLAEGAARGDLLATLFYFANWHFVASGQSYFSQYLSVSPIRHTWSLAVEEQFYLLWPLLVVAILARFPRRALVGATAAIAVASAVLMAILFDPIDPSRAYYGTDTRIFEILIGALAALMLAGPAQERVAGISRRLAWPAFIVVVASFIALADDDALYYHGAAVGFAAAAAALIVGVESGSGLRRLLSLRPLVIVGLVSYGLYLWHFPVITFIGSIIGPTSSPLLALLAIAVTFGATGLSYVLIETPIRRSRALLGFSLTPRRLVGLVPAASGVVAAIVLATTVSGVATPAWSTGTAAAPADVTLTGPPASNATGGGRVIANTIGVVGDSVMASALPGLQAEAAARGWRLVAAAAPGCPVALQPLFDNAGRPSPFNAGCRRVVKLHDELIAAKPNIVIWEDLQSVLSRRAPDGTFLPAGSAAWTADLLAGWTTELDRLLAAGAQVVIVTPPERSQQALGCRNVPMESRCIDLQHQDAIIRAATTAFWQSVAGRPGVHQITVDPLLCPHGVPCPTSIGGVIVRISGWDQTHFTVAGAKWFAPRLLDLVVGALKTGT